MGGDVTQYEAMASITLLQVKEMVRECQGVKTADQVLMMGGTVLENNERLLSLAQWFLLGDLLPEDTVEGFVFELALELVVSPKVCKSCGSPARHKCGGCAAVRYCGVACQTLHWQAHRLTCLRGRCVHVI